MNLILSRKSIGDIYRKLKLPFSIIKTKLLILNRGVSVKKKYFASTDNGVYPELALKASMDPLIFSVFRRHHKYTPALEHVSRRQGAAYLKYIREKYKLNNDSIINLTSPLQKIGNPKLMKFKDFPLKISTTALRYLKIALDINQFYGHNLGNVVEIGCGYGGQALILDKVCNLTSYAFYDLWEVNFLIQRFIESSDFNCEYKTSTIRELTPQKEWDVCISNYAFSEMGRDLQNIYIDKIINNSKKGYMIMNSGKEGYIGNVKNNSQEELLKIIKKSKIKDVLPFFHKDTYLLVWDKSKNKI